ncbi:MAG: asparaginase [Bacteroidia bacterium]|jgi:L-asparaginase II|nr:asparaginase [Bacteroidia bacterium]
MTEHQNPILVEIYRGGVLESFHRGVVCIVDSKGQVVYSAGNHMQICYPRSAMKLLQVLPLLMENVHQHYSLTLEEIAVMCGSHNAEPEHVDAVNSILHKIGLGQEALLCGAQMPSDKNQSTALIKAGLSPQAIHNNCSGKHAGMLALCVHKGWSTHDYLLPEHPLQQYILRICSTLYEYSSDDMTIALDGCSAPIVSVPVYHQALAFKSLANPTTLPTVYTEAISLMWEAISKYPFMVAGTKRYCTDLMKITAPDIIGKTGAEGVFCMAIASKGWGICIKIDDGKMLPQYHVAQAIVEAINVFSPQQLQPLQQYLRTEIKNFNKWVTGEIKVNDQFMFNLSQACASS